MPLKITDTTLRDAHQSLIATRMRLADILPVAAQMDAAGFFSLEAWGGATFDSCIRFLNEDPWDRLRALRVLHALLARHGSHGLHRTLGPRRLHGSGILWPSNGGRDGVCGSRG